MEIQLLWWKVDHQIKYINIRLLLTDMLKVISQDADIT